MAGKAVMPLVEYSPGELLEVLSMLCTSHSDHVCPRGRGFGSQQRLPGAAHTAGPGLAASLGEQPGSGVGKIIWGGKNLPRLPGMLEPLPALLTCSDTPWPCQGCTPMGKGWWYQKLAAVVTTGFIPLLWVIRPWDG